MCIHSSVELQVNKDFTVSSKVALKVWLCNSKNVIMAVLV